jgi:hypothetical protein
MDSPDCERSVVRVIETVDAGCRLCEAITHKFRSLQPDLLSLLRSVEPEASKSFIDQSE